MILRRVMPDGSFLVITTRKANHAPQIFGKATLWQSQMAYSKGDCFEAYTIINFYLCDDPADLSIALQHFGEYFIKLINTAKEKEETNETDGS